MKKPPSTPVVQDQVSPPCKSKNHRAAKPPRFITRLAPTLLGKHRPICYISGEKPRKEPTALPRLFIRGLGGSLKLDLRGVGVGLSNAVFAHFVADDALLPLHVCRGDIALIEPAIRRTHNGNLVLLELDGRPVIRRLRKQKHLWMLNSVDGSSDDSVLPANQGIQGVVIGFVRLFNKLRPVRYEGTDANYSPGFEVPARPRKRRERVTFQISPRSRVHQARSKTDAGHLFSVNEV